MEMLSAILNRRSIRQYQQKSVEDEKLTMVLEAARLAPSARNRQDIKLVIVRDAAMKEELQKACWNQTFISQAPLAIAVCATQEVMMNCGQAAHTVDCSIALSFMMLQATELGLGTCWMGGFEQAPVKKALELPEEYSVVAVTPLGYPESQPEARPRKPLEELVIWK